MIFFDTPSSGMLSQESLESISTFNKAMAVNPSAIAEQFRASRLPELRNLLADFSDAKVSEIALIPNTSFGLNAVLSSLRDISSVLLYDREYNGLTMPFDQRDYSVYRFSAIDGFDWNLDEIKTLLVSNNIELFVFSAVQWQTGYRADYNELCSFCKENEIISILDLSQSIGSLAFSFSNCHADVVLASNYKWMNAGFGSGIMWMRKSFVKEHIPTIAGYNSAAPLFDFENFESSIRCYEPGHLNLHGFSALIPALKKKLELGTQAIEEHNLNLTNTFIQKAKESDFEIIGDKKNRSSIVVLKNEKGLKNYLDEHHVVCKERGEGIRFGFHFHNSMDEVLETCEILSKFRKSSTL